MMKITRRFLIALASWLALTSTLAAAAPGELITYAGKAPPGWPGSEWIEADGSFLSDIQYPELAAAVHDGDNWPFGRCDADHFKLPKLSGEVTGRNAKMSTTTWIKAR